MSFLRILREGTRRRVRERVRRAPGIDCWSGARECSATHHRAGATEVDVESLHEPEGLRCQHADSLGSARPSGQTGVSTYGTPIHDTRRVGALGREIVAWVTPPG